MPGWIFLLVNWYLNFCNAFSISQSTLSVSISVSETFLYLQVNYINPSICNVLKYYYWWLSSIRLPLHLPVAHSSLSLSIFHCACVPTLVPWSASNRLVSGILATVHTRPHRPTTRQVAVSSRSHESSASAPALALIPRTRRANTSLLPDLPARRQAGFDSLSAASPSASTPSLPNTSARPRPPVPHRVAAVELFP